MPKKDLLALPLIMMLVMAAGCSRDISFKKDIAPILERNCQVCHTKGRAGYVKSGFSVTSYEDIMKGTKFGPVIIPNSSLTSSLVMLIEHRADPSISMPHGRAPLPRQDIELIKQWIDQGARNN